MHDLYCNIEYLHIALQENSYFHKIDPFHNVWTFVHLPLFHQYLIPSWPLLLPFLSLFFFFQICKQFTELFQIIFKLCNKLSW